MGVSRNLLARLADETGFRAQTLEKVIHLGELAADVSRHPLLSRALVLKGGTALNLCFGPPPRLSVDLDFNYILSVDREAMLRDRPEVERAIDTIARARGYRVQWSRDEHAGRKVYLGYVNASGAPDRIEVDLNFLFRIPLAEPALRRLWQPHGAVPEVMVVGAEELCAGKLCALLDRVLPRDLFDSVRVPAVLAHSWGTVRFRRLFVALAGILDHSLTRYGAERFDRVTDIAVEHELHPMLNGNERPVAEELRRGAAGVVAPLLALDHAEREFSERLQRGELQPELLFPDDSDTAERLRAHPALRWKAENAGLHARGR